MLVVKEYRTAKGVKKICNYSSKNELLTFKVLHFIEMYPNGNELTKVNQDCRL